MILKINGKTYFSTNHILQQVGISRQTLWRWRQEGKIPPGHRYRDGKVLFTSCEVEIIKRFADHVEPIGRSKES